jgi:hypothetical protein
VPGPEQKEAGVYNEPLQLAGAHIAVEVWHLPAPSQLLIAPQPLPTWPQRVSVAPDPIGAHAPMPTLHDWQAPQLGEPQQTPSTQLPLLHSAMAEQAIPLALRLQLFAPAVPWQVFGAWQSPSTVQVVLQAPGPQMYGVQFLVGGGAHAPAPSQ